MGTAQREDEVVYKVATQAVLNMALIWALKESSRLPFVVKEFYLKSWEETEFTG